MNAKSPLLPLFKEQLENESSKIATDHSLQKRGDYLIWWYFLRLQSLDTTDVASCVCDGGGDLGIDAIHIDEDDLVHFYQFKNPERIESSLPAGEVDKMLTGLGVILNRKHASIANEELKRRIEEIYQIVPTGYRIHLVTSGLGMSSESQVKLNSFVESLRGPSEEFFAWTLEDLEHLQDRFYQKTLPTVEQPIVFTLEKQPPYQVRSADHDCYMFHTSGEVLADLYTVHGEQLLQQNIRVFQGDRATNSLIRQTASGNESGNFFHYNNGVTLLCETAKWDQFQSTMTLNKAQVVNGGQTVRVLHRVKVDKALKSSVVVPVRVITSQGDKQFASDVAVNLNNQNRIESSFLRSNDPRVVQLAHSLESAGWYLERRENEVANLTDSEKRTIELRLGRSLQGHVIRLRDGAQAYVATFLRMPELAKKNPKRIFLNAQDGGVYDRVFNNEISAEKLVSAHKIKTAVDGFIRRFTALKQRKSRVADWKAEYQELLTEPIVTRFVDKVDQVIPQSGVFLCALIYETQCRVGGQDPESVASTLEAGDMTSLINELAAALEFAVTNPENAIKSWPTLLKSQGFFENVCSFRLGQTALMAGCK
ncbi:MAG: AIPR family protein [Planctomycetaceae bacterium]